MILWAWSLVPFLLQDRSLAKTPPFLDVPPGHWAAQAVQNLKDEGILVGYPPEKPKPSSPPAAAPAKGG
jgi:hypothetical protein